MTVPAQENVAVSADEKKVTPAESFQQMRKMLEQERSEKEKMRQDNERLSKEIQRAKTQSSSDDEDSDEPYIDPRSFKRRMEKFEESMEQKIDRRAEEKARSLIDEEKRQTYLKQNADFEKVMSPEVLQKLNEKHPTLVETILKMPDSFERQKLVYETIKSTGVNKKEEVSGVQDKINANKRSPYYQPSGVGTAPYAGGGDFSDTGQKTAYNQMKELQKRLRI